MASVTESDILRQMAVREEAGVHVIGCFDRRITLYTQQVRALNLIHSLFVEERLKTGSKLAVIGGGAAGLTAAAGAAIRGARVTVFEEASDVLPMFRNNRQRWLHPHLYDWPEEGSEEAQANLPVLDWKADLAGNVAELLLEQWQPLARKYGIEVHTRVQRLQLLPGSSAPRQLTWNTDSFDEEEFEAIILAVGFGTERKLKGAPSRSYWEDDNLDRLHMSSTPKRYLISGTGDGGLIDLLRVRLRDFRHERIIQRYLRDASLREVKAELRKLEEEFRKGGLQERDFFKKYKELAESKELDDRLREDLRGDTTAVLNGRDAFPLSARASILNRFLTSRLMPLGNVRYESGEPSVKRVKNAYEVTFLDENKHPKYVEKFDDIIVRYGPRPALERSFKSLWEKAGAQMRELAELDQTRRPLFKPENFAHFPSGVVVRSPAVPAIVSAPVAAPSPVDCFGREELTRQPVLGRANCIARLGDIALERSLFDLPGGNPPALPSPPEWDERKAEPKHTLPVPSEEELKNAGSECEHLLLAAKFIRLAHWQRRRPAGQEISNALNSLSMALECLTNGEKQVTLETVDPRKMCNFVEKGVLDVSKTILQHSSSGLARALIVLIAIELALIHRFNYRFRDSLLLLNEVNRVNTLCEDRGFVEWVQLRWREVTVSSCAYARCPNKVTMLLGREDWLTTLKLQVPRVYAVENPKGFGQLMYRIGTANVSHLLADGNVPEANRALNELREAIPEGLWQGFSIFEILAEADVEKRAELIEHLRLKKANLDRLWGDVFAMIEKLKSTCSWGAIFEGLEKSQHKLRFRNFLKNTK